MSTDGVRKKITFFCWKYACLNKFVSFNIDFRDCDLYLCLISTQTNIKCCTWTVRQFYKKNQIKWKSECIVFKFWNGIQPQGGESSSITLTLQQSLQIKYEKVIISDIFFLFLRDEKDKDFKVWQSQSVVKMTMDQNKTHSNYFPTILVQFSRRLIRFC